VEPSASSASERAAPAAPLPTSVPPRGVVPDDRGGYASHRLAAYASAAALDGADEVEGRIENLAVELDSLRRDLELEALLARLAELDPPRAMRLTQSLFLDDRFVVAAFTAAAV